MSATELEPVYLLTGTDLPKIASALRRLRARFADGSVERLAADAASGADAVAAVNALGLFGGGERLVVVEGVERWKKADVEAVAAYLRSPTPGAVLALVGDASRLAGLEAAVASAGSVLRWDVPTRRRGAREVPDFPPWVRQQLERLGVQVDRDAARRLVEIVGEDAFALQAEAEKIAAWAAGEPVGGREVDLLATPAHEASAYAIADAWGARDVAGALSACDARLRLGDEPFVLAARLADHVARVRAVQALAEQGVRLQEMAQRLGLRYPPRREAGHAANVAREDVDAALVRLAELDHALKGGSRLDPELELERALIEITGPRERLSPPA